MKVEEFIEGVMLFVGIIFGIMTCCLFAQVFILMTGRWP